MNRRAGLIVLLSSVVLAVLLAGGLRQPSQAPSAQTDRQAAHPGGQAPRLIPTEAQPARVSRGRLRGGPPPAPEGYDVSIAAVPLETILDTDLSPEDVPALDTPAAFSRPSEYPPDQTIVIGVVVDGVARAYRTDVLNYHWAVNDVIDGRRVLILWDPIAGAAAVYQGGLDGRPVEAGVSGKWYEGNALFYDRQSTSLFPAITGRFVTGPLAGRALRPLPFRREPWATWLKDHPDSKVLHTKLGWERDDYDVDPFATLDAQPDRLAPLLPGAASPGRVPPMEWVVGFVDPIGKPTGCAVKDLPEDEPLRLDRALVERRPDGRANVTLSGGVWPQQTMCRYFAWAGLHPDTEVWPTAHEDG